MTAETTAAAASPAAAALREAGLPEGVARLVAAAPALEAAPAIVRLASTAGMPPVEAGAAWHRTGEAFHLPALRAATTQAEAHGPFGTRAKAALLDDIAALQARLAAARLRGDALPQAEAAARVAQEAASRPDLAAVTVAVRALARVLE
jgi:glutamate dehydrogenase